MRMFLSARLFRAAVCRFQVALVIASASSSLLHAADYGSGIESAGTAVRKITVTRFKSRTFELARPFTSAVAGATDIADVLPVSDRVLYVQGKKAGTTNVSIFGADKRLLGVLDVEVTLDTQTIAEKIRAMPGGNAIRVSSSHDQILLSGQARNAAEIDRAVAIAKSMSPDSPVVNLMQLTASQQVMLKVRFIEASRDAGRDLGVNWSVADATGKRGFSTGLGSLTQAGPSAGGVPVFKTLGTFAGAGTTAPFGVALANILNRGGSIDVLINALETKGLARRLAEPDLVALSGDTASFLAGGEVPVPVVQPSSGGGAPTITVDYKPFGVQLTFVPTVLADGIINLRLTPSVSELDYTNAIRNESFLIPALSKREARTTIELRDGQSFAIAGLLQTEGLRNVSQLPWLGSVPVLGALFRSSAYQQHETDLVVIVTPHLVAPTAPGQRLATPLDTTLPGNDTDFFLLGKPEVRKRYTDYVESGRGLLGPYGHIVTVGDR